MSVPAPASPGVAARAVDLRKIYGQGDAAVQALRGVSVDFAAAEFTAIMGPSGSGKSTLLHCMAGLDTPTSGNVLIGDVDLTTLSEKALTKLRRDKVGFVFQAFNLIPTLTASENITLPLDIAGRDVVTYAQMIERIADSMGVGRLPLSLGFSLTPPASAVVASVTGLDLELVRPLMESLEYDLLPRDDANAHDVIPVRLHRFDRAVEHALAEWESIQPLAAR